MLASVKTGELSCRSNFPMSFTLPFGCGKAGLTYSIATTSPLTLCMYNKTGRSFYERKVAIFKAPRDITP